MVAEYVKLRRIILFGLLAFLACHPNHLDKNDLIKYINKKRSLSQIHQTNGIDVGVKYYPSQLFVAHELDEIKKYDSSAIRGVEKKYDSQYYFRLYFSKDNKEVARQLGNFQSYSAMLHVLSFEIGKYINATSDHVDTVYLADYLFEQEYGMSNTNSILLAFKRNDFEGSKNIQINISEFGLGIGIQQFVFKKNDLDNIPLLSYTFSGETINIR